MSIARSERAASRRHPNQAVAEKPAKVFDRSSFEGDFPVLIPCQTSEDFELYASERQRCEYFDGVIYMPSPVTDRHQLFVGFFFDLFNGFQLERGIGTILMGPGVLRLSDDHKPEPNVFIRPTGADEWDPRALLVVEILSTNRAYDLEFKRAIYEQAGIPEVWYVDDRDKALIVIRKEGDSYRMEHLTEGIVVVPSVPGLWINVSWLWSKPLPSPRRCLETILAGIPG